MKSVLVLLIAVLAIESNAGECVLTVTRDARITVLI
jgi:hypothetical protein